VQVIARPIGLVTVQDIEPAGSGFDEEVPATRVVRVDIPPKVGELDDVSEIVGTRLDIPKVTEFEVALR
jgi:hypothetical protein